MTEETTIAGNNQNTVDTSAETVNREFSQLLAEATSYENAKPKPVDPSNPEPELMPEANQAAIDAAGDQVKMMLQMPLGTLLEFGGCILADTDAPNWRLHGLTDEHIRSVAMPLGAVADKYCFKFFGVSTTELLAGHEEEAALLISSVVLWKTFKNVPRNTEGASQKLAAIREQEMKDALKLKQQGAA